jgi:hypothetical protein
MLRRDISLPRCKAVSVCSAITGRGRRDEWRWQSVGRAADSGPRITGRVEMLIDLVRDGAKKKREATENHRTCLRPTTGDLGRTPTRFPWKRAESERSSLGSRNQAALTSLPAAEERGWSSLGTGLRRRAGDFIAGAARGQFSAARERQGSLDLGEMMVTVGPGEWRQGKRWARRPRCHAAANQMASAAADSLQ